MMRRWPSRVGFVAGVLFWAGRALPARKSFSLVAGGRAVPLPVSDADHAGVVRTVGDLRADVERVTGISPAMSAGPRVARSPAPVHSRMMIVNEMIPSSREHEAFV